MGASSTVIGAPLYQVQNNEIEPLVFLSHKFSTNEMKYLTYNREPSAMYAAIKYSISERSWKVVVLHLYRS